jgi:cysteine-rich repeat protein
MNNVRYRWHESIALAASLIATACADPTQSSTDGASTGERTTGDATTGGTAEPTSGDTEPTTDPTSGGSGGMTEGTSTVDPGTSTSPTTGDPGTSTSTTGESTGIPAACGNGSLDGDEQCDDGNAAPADGCEADCQPTKIARVFAGGGQTCALFESGDIRCWGYNAFGQLGYGHKDNIGDDELPSSVGVVDVGGPVESMGLGSLHACAVLVGGGLRCWGHNNLGQLGLGHTDPIGDDEPPSAAAEVDVGGPVKQVVVGGLFTCALLADATVRCWGDGYRIGSGATDHVGDDESPSAVAPVDVGGPVTAITAGAGHTCALLEGGAVRCWGDATVGRLGTGNAKSIGDDEVPASIPPVDLGGDAVQISANNFSTCAVMMNGAVRCWGDGAGGQLGYGSSNIVGDMPGEMPPADVPLGGPVKFVDGTDAAIGGQSRCAVRMDDSVVCWGNANFGLGYGDTEHLGDQGGEMPPPAVELGGPVTQFVRGATHACVVTEAGALRCFGGSSQGELGSGDTNNIGDAPGEMPPPEVAAY